MKLVSLLSLAAFVCSGAVAQQQPGQSAGIAITAPALGVSCLISLSLKIKLVVLCMILISFSSIKRPFGQLARLKWCPGNDETDSDKKTTCILMM